MKPVVWRNRRNEAWVLPVSGMCLVLGFMIATAWVTEKNRISRYPLLDASQKPRVSAITLDVEAYQEMSNEVNKLRAEITTLQDQLAKGGSSSKLLNESLQEAKVFAGLTKVDGPGIVVTLKDSAKGGLKVGSETVFTPETNIHDLDVLRVVNELFAAGAEAISVADHRIAGPSAIRCVGPTILVNDVKVAPPIAIKAIGDPKVLMGGLNINGGVLSEIRTQDPSMVAVEEIKRMTLPAYSGRTNFRLAKPASEKSTK